MHPGQVTVGAQSTTNDELFQRSETRRGGRSEVASPIDTAAVTKQVSSGYDANEY